ncbi:DUF1127 domain-containing protein [Alkalimarinus coralli]|uniref:DUF1127 domain-containing protein n=1 Tax=Alkalimarinus coralli TaxID=2935863 RepID=UPI00202B7B4B|nr:DUF1127 domain-containing protein [Alkalimarinus coralli]
MTSIVRFGRYQVILVKRERERSSWVKSLNNIVTKLREYRENSRQRRQLAQLPDYLLKDIGITRADALKEAEKPFWQ